MKLIKSYIQSFLSRSGSFVFTATIISKFLAFFASWIALQLIPNKQLGTVLYAYNIITFLIPFSGLGLSQSLIRYGALVNDDEKNSLFLYVLKKGIIATIFVILIVTVLGYLFPFKYENMGNTIAFLSLILIPLFVFEIIKIQFRLKHDNKSFSKVDIIYNIFLVVSIFIFSYFFKSNGYIFALILTPTLASILFLKKLNINYNNEIKLNITNFSFWKYGFYSGVTNVVTNLLVVVDLLLIGHLINNSEMITFYKYISIIPLNLVFIPQVFIATDFVFFTEKINDKEYIFKYIKSYMSLFSLISFVICLFFFFLSKETLTLFGSEFIQYSESFCILIFGTCGILIFRGLFGNLLSSIGKIEVNSYIIIIALIINVFGNFHLIPLYGIKGAAITSAILMWFTGIFSCIWFLHVYKKYLKN